MTCLSRNNALGNDSAVYCFDSCRQRCAQDIASSGNLYLSCFLPGCGPSSLLSRSSGVIRLGTGTNFSQLNPDYTAVASKLGQPVAFHDTGSFQRGIGVKGKASFTVNPWIHGKGKFYFDYFSARVGFDSSAPDHCNAQKFIVRISSDKYNTLVTKVGRLESKEVFYRVKNASHLKLDIVPMDVSMGDTCLYSAWADAKLTVNMPWFLSCLDHCYTSARKKQPLLSCFMGSCPGQVIHKKLKNVMRLEKTSDDAQICVDFPCHTHLQENYTITARGITMTQGTTISFNLTEMRRLGYKADILKTNLSLTHSQSCSNVSLRPGTVINTTFQVTLDRKNIYQREFHETTSSHPDEHEAQVVLDVSRGSQIAFVVNGSADQQCIAALWKSACLEEAKPFDFQACNKRCQQAVDDGHIYLSCFLGVCSGGVAYDSNQPFFTLHHQHWGIGADRPGGWADGRDLIRFQYAPTVQSNHGTERPVIFDFGIGAFSPSSMDFNLNAFREHGFHFNAFFAIIGIDVKSGCKNTTGSMFQIHLDDSHTPVFATYVPKVDSVREILVPVQNANKLRLGTLTMFGKECSNAAWAKAQLIEISPVSHTV